LGLFPDDWGDLPANGAFIGQLLRREKKATKREDRKNAYLLMAIIKGNYD
jgi:hypothetical protein